MSDLQTIPGGTVTRIEHDGVAFEFGLLTRGAMERLSARLVNRDRDRLVALYEGQPDILKERLQALEDRVLDGEYDFLEERVMGAVGEGGLPAGGMLRTKAGMLLLASVLTGRPETDVLRLLIARPVEFDAALSMSLALSLGVKARGPAEAEALAAGPAPNA